MKRIAILLALIALSGCGLKAGMICGRCGEETRFIVPLYTYHIDETKPNGFVTPPDDCPYSMAVSDFENEYFPNYICRDI